MAKKNIQWINSRACWRFSKYERMTGKMSPYKLFTKDAGDAAWELFKQMKLKTKGQPKCKEWALNKNYEIWSVSKNKRGEAQIEHFKNGTMAVRDGKTEPESIFQTCNGY